MPSAPNDLECAIGDRSRLANELIEPWVDERSLPMLVDVEPVGPERTRRGVAAARGDQRPLLRRLQRGAGGRLEPRRPPREFASRLTRSTPTTLKEKELQSDIRIARNLREEGPDLASGRVLDHPNECIGT
jgi:hypothetical protein